MPLCSVSVRFSPGSSTPSFTSVTRKVPVAEPLDTVNVSSV